MVQKQNDQAVPYEALIGDSRNHSRRVHLVEFFDEDEQIIEAVSRYVFAGINGGEGIIIVGSRDHNAAVAMALAKLEVDVDLLIEARQIQFLDAKATLDEFMDGDRPNPDKFQNSIGELMDQMTKAFPLVRAYGEMVDILAAEGNLDGALALEDLWNNLSETHSFSLLCGYQTDSLSGADRDQIERVCSCHTHSVSVDRVSKFHAG